MIVITVCVGSACYVRGSKNIIEELKKLIIKYKCEDDVVLKGSCCLQNCKDAVAIKINEEPVQSVNEENIEAFFSEYVLKKI